MTGTGYRYDRFHRQLLVHDFAFEGGPVPGEPFPDFALPGVDGDVVRKSDFVGARPMLMVFSSFT
jgi:hypothetical protein